MSRARVAVLKTTPDSVLDDVGRVMHLAGYRDVISKEHDTALKINISWHKWYPACSTTPWQLEGVIRTMLADGYRKELIHACHNRTVVVSARVGERANRHLGVVNKYGLRNIHLYEDQDWIRYEPKGKIRVLRDIYPHGIHIPRRFVGENIIHLPTVKTHVFTTTTGAMTNAFGGLLTERRHWTHPVIHETLVDLLMIQKRIHRGVFAVMDGTFAGDGPGPRCMTPHVKNVILASADQVAIDAVAAKLMGMDPMQIKFIRLAHEAGLGCGDPRDIQIAGDQSAAQENWHFQGPYSTGMTFASRMQHRIYWGNLRGPLQWSLKTVIAPWAYIASVVYHDSFWYPKNADRAMAQVLKSDWGRLFQNWERVVAGADGYPDVGEEPATVTRLGPRALRKSVGILGTCIREAPEFASRRRHHHAGMRNS